MLIKKWIVVVYSKKSNRFEYNPIMEFNIMFLITSNFTN